MLSYYSCTKVFHFTTERLIKLRIGLQKDNILHNRIVSDFPVNFNHQIAYTQQRHQQRRRGSSAVAAAAAAVPATDALQRAASDDT